MSRPRTESALAFMRALEGEDVDREALPRTLAAVEADERRRFVEEELPGLLAKALPTTVAIATRGNWEWSDLSAALAAAIRDLL